MSDLTAILHREGENATRAPRPRTLADHPLVQLTLVRFREFMREPEALFWVFIFPILLAAGLGIAFRNRPADVLPVAAVTPQLAAALRPETQLDVREMPPAAAAQALRTGKVALVAEPGPGGSVIYHFDDTNPEGRAAVSRPRALKESEVSTQRKASSRFDPRAGTPKSSQAKPSSAPTSTTSSSKREIRNESR